VVLVHLRARLPDAKIVGVPFGMPHSVYWRAAARIFDAHGAVDVVAKPSSGWLRMTSKRFRPIDDAIASNPYMLTHFGDYERTREAVAVAAAAAHKLEFVKGTY